MYSFKSASDVFSVILFPTFSGTSFNAAIWISSNPSAEINTSIEFRKLKSAVSGDIRTN